MSDHIVTFSSSLLPWTPERFRVTEHRTEAGNVRIGSDRLELWMPTTPEERNGRITLHGMIQRIPAHMLLNAAICHQLEVNQRSFIPETWKTKRYVAFLGTTYALLGSIHPGAMMLRWSEGYDQGVPIGHDAWYSDILDSDGPWDPDTVGIAVVRR